MRNIKLVIEYEGTGFAGWQVQATKSKTIQGEIEKALRRILCEKVKVVGSGRTDSGVHARGQVANFKTTSKLPINSIKRALNSLLKPHIAVREIEEAEPDFHARFSAKNKLYRYTIFNDSVVSPFLSRYVHSIPYKLDVELMKKEAKVLLGRHDFKAFQASDKRRGGSVRTLKRLDIEKDGNLIYIDVESDGFLYNMVRNIVGTLIEVGRGKFPPGSTRKILESKDRRLAGPSAPAKGLCLLHVTY